MLLTQIVRELEAQRKKPQTYASSLDLAIATLRGLIGRRPSVMSAAARERFAAAQKARWGKDCLKVQEVVLVGIGLRINKHSTHPEFHRLFRDHAMKIMTPSLGYSSRRLANRADCLLSSLPHCVEY